MNVNASSQATQVTRDAKFGDHVLTFRNPSRDVWVILCTIGSVLLAGNGTVELLQSPSWRALAAVGLGAALAACAVMLYRSSRWQVAFFVLGLRVSRRGMELFSAPYTDVMEFRTRHGAGQWGPTIRTTISLRGINRRVVRFQDYTHRMYSPVLGSAPPDPMMPMRFLVAQALVGSLVSRLKAEGLIPFGAGVIVESDRLTITSLIGKPLVLGHADYALKVADNEAQVLDAATGSVLTRVSSESRDFWPTCLLLHQLQGRFHNESNEGIEAG